MIALRHEIDAMRTGDLAAGTGSNLEAQLELEEADSSPRCVSVTARIIRTSSISERTIQNQKARIAAGGKEDAKVIEEPGTPAS